MGVGLKCESMMCEGSQSKMVMVFWCCCMQCRRMICDGHGILLLLRVVLAHERCQLVVISAPCYRRLLTT